MEAISSMMWQGNYGCLTIDAICERADVRKGSFYHFFNSKSDLAAAAIQARWDARKPAMDALFSSTIPPMQRLKAYFDEASSIQMRAFKEQGRMLGCPDFSVGAEISATAPEIAEKVRQILRGSLQYFETAIRDGKAAGVVNVDDVAASARMVLSHYEGVLTQARIHNDPDILDDIWPGTLRLLGITSDQGAKKSV
jgi:TetR/AcrR family transcriptional repressor of nem operon